MKKFPDGNVEHSTVIKPLLGGFKQAVCLVCEWKGPQRLNPADAEEDSFNHVLEHAQKEIEK
jgi:hypothetical protein